jgi:hypothetical protein
VSKFWLIGISPEIKPVEIEKEDESGAVSFILLHLLNNLVKLDYE